MGLLGVTVPENLGGLGLGYLEHTIAMEGECTISGYWGLFEHLRRFGTHTDQQN